MRDKKRESEKTTEIAPARAGSSGKHLRDVENSRKIDEKAVESHVSAARDFWSSLFKENHIKMLPKRPQKRPQTLPREAQETPRVSQEHPRRPPKPPPEHSKRTLGRPRGLLGWFWEPQGLIFEPPRPIFLCFPTFPAP